MSKYQNKPDNGVRYALDDTIIESPIRKTSIKVKGVTYFDRQENLKKLYEQKLSKEDKHLRLEKFYLGKTQTLCVLFNDLEIGTIPLDQLEFFMSPNYSYELTNIHIGIIKDENDKEIYFAKLFVTFTDNNKSNCLYSESDSKLPVVVTSSLDDSIATIQKELKSDNESLKVQNDNLVTENNRLHSDCNNLKLKLRVYRVAFALAIIGAFIIHYVHQNNYNGLYDTYIQTVDDYNLLHDYITVFPHYITVTTAPHYIYEDYLAVDINGEASTTYTMQIKDRYNEYIDFENNVQYNKSDSNGVINAVWKVPRNVIPGFIEIEGDTVKLVIPVEAKKK